jgi:hypothetical protein
MPYASASQYLSEISNLEIYYETSWNVMSCCLHLEAWRASPASTQAASTLKTEAAHSSRTLINKLLPNYTTSSTLYTSCHNNLKLHKILMFQTDKTFIIKRLMDV